MVRSLLSNEYLQEFICKLRINPGQERFLIDELPQMDRGERLELLETLTDVYALNREEDQAIKNLKTNWE